MRTMLDALRHSRTRRPSDAALITPLLRPYTPLATPTAIGATDSSLAAASTLQQQQQQTIAGQHAGGDPSSAASSSSGNGMMTHAGVGGPVNRSTSFSRSMSHGLQRSSSTGHGAMPGTGDRSEESLQVGIPVWAVGSPVCMLWGLAF